MSDMINVGSVAVDIVPDTRNFATDLKAKLKGVGIQVGVTADTTKLRAELDEATRDRTATVNVDANTAAAGAKIDEVARDRTANIRVNSSGLGNASRGLSGIATAALALGPALIPIGGALLGIGGALAAPLAAAGGGLTLGAFIAGFAIKDTEKQKKQIDSLAKKVASAKQALAATQASAGTSYANSVAAAHRSLASSTSSAQSALASASTPAAIASAQARLASAEATYRSRMASIQASSSARTAAAQKKVTEAVAAYQAALKGLSPEQRRFLKAQANLKGAFKNLERSAGPAIFGPLIKGMQLISHVMPALKPVIKGVADALDSVMTRMGKVAKGPEFKAFMQGFGKLAGSSIKAFATILGNLGAGFIGLFKAAAPMSGGFLKGIENLSQKFANFGENASSNKGFQAFVSYIREMLPKVVDTIGNVIGVVVKLVQGLAPLGGVILGAIDGLASFINHAKPSTIAAIGVAVGGVAAAMGKGPLGLAFALGAVLAHSDKFTSFLKTAGGYAQDFGKWFNKLPEGIKAASLAMVGVGALAVKFRGGIGSLLGGGKGGLGGRGGGILGGLFGAVTKAKPIPVIVVNDLPGFKKDEATSILSKSKWLAPFLQVAIPAIGGAAAAAVTPIKDRNSMAPGSAGYAGDGGMTLPGGDPLGLGDTPENRRAQARADAMARHTKHLSDQVVTLNRGLAAMPPFRRTEIDAPGLTGVMSAVQRYGGMLDGLPKRVKITFEENLIRHHSFGSDVASAGAPNRTPKFRAMGGPVYAGQPYIVGERRPELFIPSENGRIDPNPRAGGTTTIRGELSLDRQGVATITGVARDAVRDGHAAQAAARRRASSDGIRRNG